MLGTKTLLTASNLNSAYISQTNTNPQYMNSTLTLSGGALTLKNSILTDNASASYFRIDPQGNNVIIYDGVNNQRLDVYSSSGSESTYLTTVNGTPSIGHLDVSSAIDHLEINTLSVKPVTIGSNLTINGFMNSNRAVINSTNSHLQFQESGIAKWHFESVGGTLNFVETSVANRVTLSPSTGNMSLLTGKLTANAGVGITSSNALSFDTYGGGFYMNDTTWIRTYGSKSFYHNSGEFRTDGTLEVGSAGATLSVPNGGNFNYRSGVLFANTSSQVGVGTASPRNRFDVQGGGVVIGANLQSPTLFLDGTLSVGNTTYSYSGNQNGETWTGAGDTITLHAKDYSTIAFLEYNTRVDYIRGGSGTIDIGYDGGWGRANVQFTNGIWNNTGKVGIGTTSPQQQVDINGSIRINSSIYSPASYVGFLTDAGGALPVKVGSLAITNGYSNNAPTNGLFVQGAVGIGTAYPASMFQVVETGTYAMEMYTASDHLYLQTLGQTSYPYIGWLDSGGVRGAYFGSGAVGNFITLGLENNNNLFVSLTNTTNKIGIGTSTPSQTVDVVGNIQTSSTFISNSTSADIFQALGASGTKTFRWEGGNLRFWNSSFGEAMTLTLGGNIGIGQASPSYKLDVTGDVRTTTAFRASSNNTEALYVGGNSAIWDVNTANTIGVYGQQNTAVGALKLGSTGPTLYGTGNTLGINTTAPNTSYTLHTVGNTYTTGIVTIGTGNTTTLTNQTDGSIRASNVNGYIDIAPKNTSYAHIYTDRPSFYFNQEAYVNGNKLLHTANNYVSTDLVGTTAYPRLVANNSGATTDTQWIRVGASDGSHGLLPYLDTQSYIGTSTWRFSQIHAVNFYENAVALSSKYLQLAGGTMSGTINLNNNSLSGTAYIYGQNGLIARSIDSWLRINDTGTVHTSGVYFGTSLVRTDGTLQVGASGANLNASSSVFNISVPNISLKTSTNGTSAFQVQNSSGTSVLSVDTTNGRIGVNNTTPLAQVDVGVKSNTDGVNVASFGGSIIPSGNNMLHVNANEDYNTSVLYWVSGNGWTDVTNIANNNSSSVMNLPSAVAPSQYLYIGNPSKVTVQNIAMSTTASGGVVAYDYWNGTSWVALTVTGNNNYTANSTITFTAPSDWALKAPVSNDATWGPSTTSSLPSTTNMSQQYWIRMKVTTAPSSTPYADYVTPSPIVGNIVTLQNAGVNRLTMDGLGNTVFNGNVTVSGNMTGLNPYCFVRAGNYNTNISSSNTLFALPINSYLVRSYGVQNNANTITIQQSGIYNIDVFLELSGLNQNIEADIVIRVIHTDTTYSDDANYFQGWNGIGGNYTFSSGAVPLTHQLMLSLNAGEQIEIFARCAESPRTMNSYIIRLWKISN